MKVLKYTSVREEFQEGWLDKTLEALENDNWGPVPKEESYLVTTCYRLRKKHLNTFNTEDLRIMIGQDLGLKYLIPLALKTLEEDILAEGDFYQGDLLKAVLTSNRDYWKTEKEDWKKVIGIFTQNEHLVREEARRYDSGNGLIEAFNEFRKLN